MRKVRQILYISLFLLVFCSGCAYSTIERVRSKLGPPAKVEQLENGHTVLYYYKACNEYNCLCNEFTYDQNGKLVKRGRYWTQGLPDVIKARQAK